LSKKISSRRRLAIEYASSMDLSKPDKSLYFNATSQSSLRGSKGIRYLFQRFFDKFALMDHLRALKAYLMLGAGDFAELLLEAMA
jgi:hypothetical protein